MPVNYSATIRWRKSVVLIILVFFILPTVGCSADPGSMTLEGNKAYKAKDYARARTLFDKACKNGDAKGCFDLGFMFASGKGSTQDEMLARINQAKNAGTFDLLFLSNADQDYVQAREFYNRACTGGYAKGCYYLAVKFDNGEGGEKNKNQARALYEQACKGGYTLGCHDLGYMFKNGIGGEQNRDQAQALYEQACTGGVARSCSYLGSMLSGGEGGARRDKARAKVLYEQACKGGYGRGCYELANMLLMDESMTFEEAYEEARPLLDQACKGGYHPSCSYH